MAKRFDMDQIKNQVDAAAQDIEEQINKTTKKEIIPVDLIDLHPDNDFRENDNEESIAELARDIKENGLYHDILVHKQPSGRYLLISGERRLLATKFNKESAISATIEEGLSPDDILIQLYNANLQTRTLSTEQKIKYIQKLKSKLSTESRARINEEISKAFDVDVRQARKLVNVSTGLISELMNMVTEELLPINDAAAYSLLPETSQKVISELLVWGREGQKDINNIKSHISAYMKKVKSLLSITKKETVKQETGLAKVSNSLQRAEKKLSQSVSDEDKQSLTIEIRKYKNTCENYNLDIETIQKKTDKKINDYTQELIKEVKEENTLFTIDKQKETRKTIQSITASIKKLETLLDGVDLSDLKMAFDHIKNSYL